MVRTKKSEAGAAGGLPSVKPYSTERYEAMIEASGFRMYVSRLIGRLIPGRHEVFCYAFAAEPAIPGFTFWRNQPRPAQYHDINPFNGFRQGH